MFDAGVHGMRMFAQTTNLKVGLQSYRAHGFVLRLRHGLDNIFPDFRLGQVVED